MRKKLIIVILVLVPVVLLAAVWFAAYYVPGNDLLTLTLRLDDPDPAVRTQARTGLHEIGTNAVPQLLALLNDNEPPWHLWLRRQLPARFRPPIRPRLQALRGLEALGPLAAPAVPAMIARLDGRRFASRSDAVLVAIGPPAVVPIEQAIAASPNVAARAQLIEVLGEMGTNAAAAVPGLLALIADPHPEVRTAVAVALGKIDLQPDDAIPELEKLLQDSDPGVRVAAVTGLGGFGPAANESVPALMGAVYDANAGVRRAALNTLLRLDNPRATLEALIELARDTEQDNRSVILNELTKREIPPAALSGLCDALKRDPDVTVRRQVPRLSKRLPPDDQVRLSVSLLSDSDQEIRITAGEMLGRSIADTPAGAPAVSLALRKCDYTTGLALLNGLARSGADALPLFCEALNNSQAGIRRQAAFFLGTLEKGGRAAVGPLAKTLDDTDPNVRLDALHALQRIDPQLVPALPDKSMSDAAEKELIAKVRAAVAKYPQP